MPPHSSAPKPQEDFFRSRSLHHRPDPHFPCLLYRQPFFPVGSPLPRFFLLQSILQAAIEHPSLNVIIAHTTMLKNSPWLPVA